MSVDPCATQDEAAYAELIEQHRAELEAHARRMLGSVHDAEDAVQEALLRAWRGLPDFEGRGSVRWWLYRIATNASLDVLRRRSRQLAPTDEEPEAPAADASPADRYERREEVERALVTADRVLTERQRTVLIMREAFGFSAEEVAQRLEMTVPAVNSALQRARATLERRADRGAAQAA